MDEHGLVTLNELLGILRANGATFFEGFGYKVVLESPVTGTGLPDSDIIDESGPVSPEERKLRTLFEHLPGGVPEFTGPSE